jgi:hypothetical protein
MVQIKGNPEFIGVVMGEEKTSLGRGQIVPEGADLPGGIPARFFDLDDAGSQIGQKLAAKAALLISQI